MCSWNIHKSFFFFFFYFQAASLPMSIIIVGVGDADFAGKLSLQVLIEEK